MNSFTQANTSASGVSPICRTRHDQPTSGWIHHRKFEDDSKTDSLYLVWGQADACHVRETIDSWKVVLPDYEIIGWNEDNFDITMDPWMKRMHDEGKYAFASDWARLHVLREHGGIYLDTDVEVKKPFDPFLGEGMFWGFEYDCYLATCVIGSRPGHPLIDLILDEYNGREDAPINNAIVTRFFLKNEPKFRLNNKEQRLENGVRIMPKEYFSVPSYDPAASFCRHHGSNLWKSGGKNKSGLKAFVRRILGEVIYFKIAAWKVCRTNEFFPIYQKHRKGE